MIIRNTKDLGALIRERRSQLKLSQDVLADRIGVSRIWISQVERGKPRVDMGLVFKALHALGVYLSVGEGSPLEQKSASRTVIDIDAIVQRARKPGR